MVTESSDCINVGRHGEVGVVPLQHARQLTALLIDRFVPHLSQLLADFLDSAPLATSPRFPQQLEASTISLCPADMREPEKVKSLRPRLTTSPALLRHKPPKGDQSRFVRVKLQRKFGYSFLEVG
jgi:hypothetical protein